MSVKARLLYAPAYHPRLHKDGSNMTWKDGLPAAPNDQKTPLNQSAHPGQRFLESTNLPNCAERINLPDRDLAPTERSDR